MPLDDLGAVGSGPSLAALPLLTGAAEGISVSSVYAGDADQGIESARGLGSHALTIAFLSADGSHPNPRFAREPAPAQARPGGGQIHRQLLGRGVPADRRAGRRGCWIRSLRRSVSPCPVAISCATVVAADRVRMRRRRQLLNRSLHELRRPLQALVLQARSGPGIGDGRRGQLDLALEALAGLDRQVNGGPEPPRSELVEAGSLAREAVARWRAAVALAGRRIEFAWGARERGAAVRPRRRLAGARQPDRERPRARPRRDPASRAASAPDGCGSSWPTAPTPGTGCRLRRPPSPGRRRTVARGRPAVATACGSSPTSPPITAGASRPARTRPAPAPCSSCRSPGRERPGAGEPARAGRRLRLRGGPVRGARRGRRGWRRLDDGARASCARSWSRPRRSRPIGR